MYSVRNGRMLPVHLSDICTGSRPVQLRLMPVPVVVHSLSVIPSVPADTGTGFAPIEPNMVEAPRTNPRNAERVFFLIFFSFLLDVTDRNQSFLIPVCFNYLFLSFKSGTFLILSFTFYNNSSCNRRCCQGK